MVLYSYISVLNGHKGVKPMSANAISFVNAFLSYLVVFLVFAALIVIAVFAGIRVRKNKNKKDEIARSAADLEAAAQKAVADAAEQ